MFDTWVYFISGMLPITSIDNNRDIRKIKGDIVLIIDTWLYCVNNLMPLKSFLYVYVLALL